MTSEPEAHCQALLEHRLTLHPAVEVIAQSGRYRDQFILFHRQRETSYLCSPALKQLLLSLDGQQTLAQALATQQIEPNGSTELLRQLQQLLEQGFFVQWSPSSDENPWWRQLRSPLAVKIPLFDPSPLVDAVAGLAPVLFNRAMLSALLVLWLLALTSLPPLWPELAVHWDSRFFDPLNLVLLPIAYLLLKFLHEMGHALALRHFGGHSRECGIFFLVLFPLPYINCSSIYRITARKKRLWVCFAGVQLELTLAALALSLWSMASPGICRDLLFNIAFTGGVSSLLFNLNPLMRFDGYYALSDLLGVYNLDRNAKASLKRLIASVAQRNKSNRPAPDWLAVYAVLAIPYRLFISLSIALYLSGKFFVFGSALAIWVVCHQLLLPLFKAVVNAYQSYRARQQSRRFLELACASALSLYLVLFELNVATSHQAEAMLITAETQQLRAPLTARVSALLVAPFQAVKRGQALIRLEDHSLGIRERKAMYRIEELEKHYQLLMHVERSQALSVKQEIKVARAELEEVQRQIASLTIVAQQDGVFSLPRGQDLENRIVPRGELLGYLHGFDPVELAAVLQEDQLDDIRHNLAQVEVMFHAIPGSTYRASLSAIVPGATSRLPSKLLGSLSGGQVAVDNREQAGTLAMDKLFVVELAISDWTHRFVPTIASVRFESQPRRVIDLLARQLMTFYLRNTEEKSLQSAA